MKRNRPNQPVVTQTKEDIREVQVIVKVRCPYCTMMYNETFDKCPQCGAPRK